MWAIKILKGAQQGKIFPLQKGNNVLGRSPKADIRLADGGVSKNHAQIFITNDKVIISDLKSTHGTFVNGTKIQNHGLRPGDKIVIHETIFTILQLPDNILFADKSLLGSTNKAIAPVPNEENLPATMAPSTLSNTTNLGMPLPASTGVSGGAQASLAKMMNKADRYIDEVALPPVYKSAEKYDFKYILLGFTFLFIFIATFLSIFPMSKIARDSVFEESKRRALALARNLEQMNRKALAEDSDLALSTDFIAREPGVERAFILSAKGGGILAPANFAGKYIRDPFVASLQGKGDNFVTEINDKQVGASVPVKFYDPDTSESVVKAYAVVVYNIDPTSVDINHTVSLFIQVFLIASIIGVAIFIVQYRIIIRPLNILNEQMDEALRTGTNDIRVPFQMKAFQDLVVKINSALSRVSKDFTSNEALSANADKSVEANEVVHLFPIPAFVVDPTTARFIATNAYLSDHPLFGSSTLLNTSIEELTEKSLYDSLKELVMSAIAAPNTKHAQILATKDHGQFEITVKTISDGNKPAYLLFTVMQVDASSAEAS